MDKKIAGLIGAAAAVATVTGVQAATPTPMTEPTAATYRDLLEPVPNALAALKAEDAGLAGRPAADGTQVAQVVILHHHHHHHHRWWRRRWHHHHHHHHHNW